MNYATIIIIYVPALEGIKLFSVVNTPTVKVCQRVVIGNEKYKLN